MASTKVPRICENCGVPFRAYISRVASGRGRFCSCLCRNESQSIPKIPRNCLCCKRDFEIHRSELWRKGELSGCFCSTRCFHTWKRVPLAVRFQMFVGETTKQGCILWTGARTPDGRGIITTEPPNTRQIAAPVAALILAGHPVPEGYCALHHCDNPTCVNVDHLFIGTRFENGQDMRAKGRHAYGERHGFAKLTAKIVIEARRRYGHGGVVSFKELAADYGVTTGAMGSAVTGRTWKHI